MLHQGAIILIVQNLLEIAVPAPERTSLRHRKPFGTPEGEHLGEFDLPPTTQILRVIARGKTRVIASKW
jgi:hypothetical protein